MECSVHVSDEFPQKKNTFCWGVDLWVSCIQYLFGLFFFCKDSHRSYAKGKYRSAQTRKSYLGGEVNLGVLTPNIWVYPRSSCVKSGRCPVSSGSRCFPSISPCLFRCLLVYIVDTYERVTNFPVCHFTRKHLKSTRKHLKYARIHLKLHRKHL